MTPSAAAEGKVILLGEHAVVYGHPALVTGLPEGARAKARPSDHACLCLGGAECRPGQGDGDIPSALEALLQVLGSPQLRIDAELLVPAGLGLGASAALGVAIARAVLNATTESPIDPVTRDRKTTEAAQAWETVFHGTPSGIDVTAAARGGCFRFVRGQAPVPLIVQRPLSLAIGIVGPHVRTKVMVEGLAQLRERDPSHVNPLLDEISSLVDEAQRAIETGALDVLGQAMDRNQSLLEALELSTSRIETACKLARDSGALGAKLTGKGGGGCVVALCPDGPEDVLAAWKTQGIECFATHVPAHPTVAQPTATP